MRRTLLISLLLVPTLASVIGCGGGGSACGDCDDGIACTSDACDAAQGACTHTPDNSLCGVGFVCDPVQGCISAPPCDSNADCDDRNPCTFDVCEPTGCANTNNNLACDDGDACTIDDACAAGTCAGTARACDDGNPCTDDGCDPATGCTASPNAAACDDGDPCTENDTCTNGTCAGALVACDDGNTCTTDSCDPANGCTYENNIVSCDDSDACTSGDVCADGDCAGAALTCDDGNLCTDDGCDPATGCTFTNNTDACDDGNPCTDGDVCSGGVCTPGANNCACNIDGDCVPFEDGNPCNGTLECSNNECVVDPATIITCDPSGDTPCAHNTCDPADGQCRMVSESDGTPCEDGDACTNSDACDSGACVGQAIACTDGDPCTDDTCDPVSGCQFPNNTEPCDDGDSCTENDTCNNGSCVGSAIDCDDGDPCTADNCVPGSGCQYANQSGGPCDDGDACTENDTCADGVCGHGQEICCSGNVDDDEDGATDCDDAGCVDDPACIVYQVDWCRLHFPASIDTLEGGLVTVFGRLNVFGLTDRTSAVDAHPDLRAQLGYGPDGSQPDAGGWSWSDAAANPAWDDGAALPPEPGNDEYMADLLIPPAAGSPYDYAYRFSMDAGQSWVYCDSDAGDGADGSEDGYSPANAGQLTSTSAAFQVDWCRLHSPVSISDEEGTRVAVYGHLNVVGLTDQTSGNDPHADVRAELGWGPDGSQPDGGAWSWSAAVPNPAWDDAAEPGNDEYMADLLVPPAAGSPYDYAYRFSADAGSSWTYCDQNAGAGSDGSQDGYSPADAGEVVAQAGSHDDSNWDLEEAFSAGDNPPDFLVSSAATTAAPEAGSVSDGAQACSLTWTSDQDQALQAGWLWAGVQPNTAYTAHAWIADNDPAGSAQLALSFGGTLDAGPASSDAAGFVELTHTAQTGAAAPWLTGLVRLSAQAGWDGDASVVVDDFDLTQAVAFGVGDGELEAWADTNPPAPSNLAAAPHNIWLSLSDQGVLYAATDRPIADQADMMMYVWIGGVDPVGLVDLPWGKGGQMAAPAAGGHVLALIQEADAGGGGYCEWRINDGSGWTFVSTDCFGATILEGSADLVALTGAAPNALPAQLSVAVAPVNTWDGGDIWSADQTPACVDCVNDTLDADETLAIHRARLLVGRIR